MASSCRSIIAVMMIRNYELCLSIFLIRKCLTSYNITNKLVASCFHINERKEDGRWILQGRTTRSILMIIFRKTTWFDHIYEVDLKMLQGFFSWTCYLLSKLFLFCFFLLLTEHVILWVFCPRQGSKPDCAVQSPHSKAVLSLNFLMPTTMPPKVSNLAPAVKYSTAANTAGPLFESAFLYCFKIFLEISHIWDLQGKKIAEAQGK